VLVFFAATGPEIFRLLGITLPAFQIAGGLVLLLSALDMLRAKRSAFKETAEETEAGIAKQDVAITPLAIPMLSGPGAITTSIVLSSKADTWLHHCVIYICIAAVLWATYLILVAAGSGAKRLSPIALNIMTRLMGLLLAAIGVQFIISAILSLR
jgi:multiple antibiotic resistance protein